MAQWHPDLHFEGSPVLRNAVVPERNFQDIMTTYPLVSELDAFLELEANADANMASVRASEMPATNPPPPPPSQQEQLREPFRRLLPVYHHYVAPILEFEGAYFTHAMMNGLNIPCVPLDFITGDVLSSYVKYFQPMSKELLNDRILDSKTDDHVREYKERVGIHANSVHENNYAQAMSIWENGVAQFLSPGPSENHNHLPDLQPNLTRWRVVNNGYTQLHRREGNGTNWSAEGIFNYYTNDGAGPDETRPHVVAFVADQAPLKDGLPSTSAVQTAFWLAGTAAAQDFRHNHNVFPVTVVCCSGHKVRVLQVVIDFLRRAIEIRLSQIIDLRDPPFGDWTAFLHFLCWFHPDPIGETAAF
ncbi:unnamed protein product [Clonostachys solani]|uniref:Uncharacterized protein n=1 Tax=Clonostachys solani TaxID=160281 RepID=A0A9N9W438_9HYPO|nr:unnamed protein product [Clonostachys solani]